MPTRPNRNAAVLTINAGSSSLKFAIYRATRPPSCLMSGKFERIGLPDSELTVTDVATGKKEHSKLTLDSHEACVPALVRLLEGAGVVIKAIGHRVVHGGPHYGEPQKVSKGMLAELRRLREFDPEHLPAEIGLIEELGRRFPKTPQVACFDTSFHRDMPRVAKLLPIPRRYDKKGVQRYGFHGLSYTYLMQELKRLGARPNERVILAHLGNGASMAAVRDGKSIDTTMAFTPAAGLVMSTRTGDLDPGLVAYFARTEGMTPKQFNRMVNAESGLLGVSETSSDVRDLLERESHDPRAAEALELFCHQARKWIGALTAALGGLDTLVFSGGIGENSVAIRARICEGLGFLGFKLDPARNKASEPILSRNGDKVTVRMIRTDEESIIARAAINLVAGSSGSGKVKSREASPANA
ncbi:MAG: ackA [Pedosphaera sp.]|nr:ackA [Pedosphaera sp.]